MYILLDWGQGQINHKKVCEINTELKKRGVLTWLDEERMSGNVQEKMTMGIDNATIAVTFITKNYMEKVNGPNAGDNCKLEFRYCCSRKTSSKMLAVVMEEDLRSTNKWVGIIGMNLGGELYVDMCNDQYLKSDKMDELYDRIVAMIGDPLRVLFEKMIENILKYFPILDSLLVPDSPTSPISKALNNINLNDIDESGNIQMKEMAFWFVNSAGLVPKAADKIALLVFGKGIGRIDRLAKKLKKNSFFLKELEIDEDDEEDIITALEKVNGDESPVKSQVTPITPTQTPKQIEKIEVSKVLTEEKTIINEKNTVPLVGKPLVGKLPVQISGAIGSACTINGIYEDQ